MGLIRRLSIQSKLILVLLSISLTAVVAIALIGYVEARRALGESVATRLSAAREAKANQVADLISEVRRETVALAGEAGIVRAMKEFAEAYRKVGDQPPPGEGQGSLEDFYTESFLPALEEHVEAEPVLESHLPQAPTARALQTLYIARNPNAYRQKSDLDEAGGGSEYDAVHARLHPALRETARGLGFDDLLLIDPDSGAIVYSVAKATDFGTSLRDGPYATSHLGALFDRITRSGDRGKYLMTDYERYRPALDEPVAFVASPIFDGSEPIGVLALRFPGSRVDRITTGGNRWEAEGLGGTGEVYLAGPDGLLRSRSRFELQDRDGLLKRLRSSGLSAKAVERVAVSDTSVLALPSRSQALAAALSGERGLTVEEDYRGEPVLAAFGPVDVEDLRWAIVAKMDTAEAFGPVGDYGRRALVATLGLAVLVTGLASVLGALASRSIRRLVAAARLVARGRTDIVVETTGEDEFGELADALNALSRGLKAKTDEVARHERAFERLLRSILPKPVADRRKQGYGVVVEAIPDVTVLDAEVVGLEERSGGPPPDQAIRIFHELVVALDEAAERRGVEKVKTTRTIYLAACGLSEQRPDHANRAVEFAVDFVRAVRRYNQEHNLSLSVRVGLHLGPVVGGVVGRQRFAFDLWGEPVELARRLREGCCGDAIRVSVAVRERLQDLHPFEEIRLEAGGETLTAWEVRP